MTRLTQLLEATRRGPKRKRKRPPGKRTRPRKAWSGVKLKRSRDGDYSHGPYLFTRRMQKQAIHPEDSERIPYWKVTRTDGGKVPSGWASLGTLDEVREFIWNQIQDGELTEGARPPNKGGVPDVFESDTKAGLSRQQQSEFLNAKATRSQRDKITRILGDHRVMPGFRVRLMEHLRYDGMILLRIGYTAEHRHGPYLQVKRYEIGARGKVTQDSP
jgi:hypothetical protein